MSVVFLFDSLDPRQRAKLVMDSPEQAAKHVIDVLNAGTTSWTLDEEGAIGPTYTEMVNRLRDRFEIKLYDQASCTGDVLSIERVNPL